MKIALLGTGKEGTSAKAYLLKQYPDAAVSEFSNFSESDLQNFHLDTFDLILRSPSVPPRWLETVNIKSWTTATKLFFEHCPCPIIGITGTKGKGTTSSLIAAILEHLEYDVKLVGNIGTPAIDVLDELTPSSVVVYEMSSFQLWDLETSPHVAVILGLEPDHLNVHKDYHDYISAKGNITNFQTASDVCVYNQNSKDSKKLAENTKAKTLAYPITGDKRLDEILSVLNIPGRHNQENATAALLAVAGFLNKSLDELFDAYYSELETVFRSFKGLPHRLEFLRELNHVKYYDDNFSTNPASTAVALAAFPNNPIVVIIGGRDKTDYEDLPELVDILRSTKTLQKIILMGESGHELSRILPTDSFELVSSLEDAIARARHNAEKIAESTDATPILLMSPAAASFDMFENVYDRGSQFQHLIEKLQ